jgi:hypothetical protein
VTGLDHRLVDDFQAVAIIFAIATVFFGIQYQKVLDTVAKRPVGGPVAKAAMVTELLQTLGYRVLPIAALSAFSAYLFLPNAIAIVRDGPFAVWRFDFLRTAWMLILTMLFITFVWAVVQIVRILSTSRHLSK